MFKPDQYPPLPEEREDPYADLGYSRPVELSQSPGYRQAVRDLTGQLFSEEEANERLYGESEQPPRAPTTERISAKEARVIEAKAKQARRADFEAWQRGESSRTAAPTPEPEQGQLFDPPADPSVFTKY